LRIIGEYFVHEAGITKKLGCQTEEKDASNGVRVLKNWSVGHWTSERSRHRTEETLLKKLRLY